MQILARILLPLLALGLAGCEAMNNLWGGSTRSGESSSVVEFLYPDGAKPPKPTDCALVRWAIPWHSRPRSPSPKTKSMRL